MLATEEAAMLIVEADDVRAALYTMNVKGETERARTTDEALFLLATMPYFCTVCIAGQLFTPEGAVEHILTAA
jgi:hypothetical protein